ncbi:sugar ABC transporter ATP-binding protein (plasmid) [Mesorhizobium sp. ORM8.1]
MLKGVSLDIRLGEILVLLGPNGAGKSTLLNIVGGNFAPSSGEVAVDGQRIDFDQYSAAAAHRYGIHRVFQELSTFPNLSVAENLHLASGEKLSHQGVLIRARERMKIFPDNRIPVRAELHDLTVAERQIVEIVRAITEDGLRLVILDEPTSALAAREASQLSELVRQKAREGVAVIYVTHKLEEALQLADRVVILREGLVSWDGDGRSIDHDRLLELLGAPSGKSQAKAVNIDVSRSPEDCVLTVDRLKTGRLEDISIAVGRGELVGIAGLEGAGQHDLLQAIFSARNKKTSFIRSESDIAYVSGDRQREGLLPIWNVEDNVSISALHKASRFHFVKSQALSAVAGKWLNELGLAKRAKSSILSLSGGNQQRALLGRALASDAPLLLLDDPTRGVDLNAKREIYRILDQVKENNRSAILYSTENAEFQKCDRVYVMARGRIAAELSRDEVSDEKIVQASFAHPVGRDAGPRQARRSMGGTDCSRACFR